MIGSKTSIDLQAVVLILLRSIPLSSSSMSTTSSCTRPRLLSIRARRRHPLTWPTSSAPRQHGSLSQFGQCFRVSWRDPCGYWPRKPPRGNAQCCRGTADGERGAGEDRQHLRGAVLTSGGIAYGPYSTEKR